MASLRLAGLAAVLSCVVWVACASNEEDDSAAESPFPADTVGAVAPPTDTMTVDTAVVPETGGWERDTLPRRPQPADTTRGRSGPR